MDQKSKFCSQCQKSTLWARAGTNHVLHMLLSLATCGLWLPIWILASVRIGGWRCQSCGHDGFEDSSVSEDGHDQGDDQLVMGGIKGGLLGGSIAGFIGRALARGGSAEAGVALVVFSGLVGLLVGVVGGAYYEKHYA